MQTELYQVSGLLQEDGKLTCTIAYDAGHEIFKGHFPGQPVVPGVCTMDLIKELLQQATGKALLLQSTGQVKFLQLILPEVQPEVLLTWQLSEQGYQATASLKAGDTFLFKMNALFTPVE